MYNENQMRNPTAAFEKYYTLFLVPIFAVVAFNLFFNLGKVPVNSWDEARHGISAYEMIKNNDYIVNTFLYKSDYWNLKPPISFWLIIFGYRLAGFNPLGLRLFSAISALFTIIIIMVFTRYAYGALASLVSGLVLATTTQYILSHCARSADADSAYVLFFTISILTISLMNKRRIWFYISGLSFSLAFLTKSWHSIALFGVLMFYLLLSGIIQKVKVWEWGLFIISLVLPVLTWGVIRFSRDGFSFFNKMILFDLLARSSRPLEGHIGGPSYYLVNLLYNFWYWIIFLIGAGIIYLMLCAGKSDRGLKSHTLLLILWILVPLLFYTYAKTKITWYFLPVYPALAICIGAFSSKIFYNSNKTLHMHLFVVIGILMGFYINEMKIQTEIMNIKPDRVQLSLQGMKQFNKYRGLKAYTVCGSPEYPTCWKQCDLLLAELYGDLKPVDGGLEKFLKDSSKSLIVLPKDDTHSKLLADLNLQIVYESRSNYFAQKKFPIPRAGRYNTLLDD